MQRHIDTTHSAGVLVGYTRVSTRGQDTALQLDALTAAGCEKIFPEKATLETDQKLAGLDSTLPALKKNADGSVTAWFGPQAPAGQEGNWVQSMPSKGWKTILRLYGPLQPCFDQSWKPGDFELVM